MMLCCLKNGGNWHYNAAMFRKKASAFEMSKMKVPHSVHDVPRVKLMKCFIEKYSMAYLIEKSKCFKKHPYERYTTDCRFQEAKRPSCLKFTEAKEYFSGMHKGY